MTDDNRRVNIRAELDRAEQSLRAARELQRLGLAADAVSRAYYAVFHFLYALLLSHGVEPRSHRGALHLFNVEFVRPGAMQSAHNRLLAGLQRTRELADYDSAVYFSDEDAAAEIASAAQFRVDALERLRLDGWLDEGAGASDPS